MAKKQNKQTNGFKIAEKIVTSEENNKGNGFKKFQEQTTEELDISEKKANTMLSDNEDSIQAVKNIIDEVEKDLGEDTVKNLKLAIKYLELGQDIMSNHNPLKYLEFDMTNFEKSLYETLKENMGYMKKAKRNKEAIEDARKAL